MKHCIILLLALFSVHVEAGLFPTCRPENDSWLSTDELRTLSMQKSITVCNAENVVYSEWEPRILQLDIVHQDLKAAMAKDDWTTYRLKWQEALVLLKSLYAEANAHRSTSGSADLISLFGPDLKYFTQNFGLGLSADLDDATAKILKGLEGDKASSAAAAGANIVQGASTRAVGFAQALAREAKERATKKDQRVMTKIIETRSAASTSNNDYFGELGKRINVLSSALAWLPISAFIAGFFILKGRQNIFALVKAPTLTFVVLIPMWLIHVFAPFVPEWIIVIGAIIGLAVLWSITEQTRFRWWWLNLIFHSAFGVEGSAARSNTSHGSARWGTIKEMITNGHLGPHNKTPGFALARVDGTPEGIDSRFRHVGHVVTVAPTGAGKGIGAVIPNLLDYPGSCLILDVKGENYAVTASARRRMGHSVHVLDPFGITGGIGDSFNVLDRLNPSDPECVSESAVLADCLVISDNNKSSDHFDDSAKTLLQGLMLHVAGFELERRTMGEVRRLLTAEQYGLADTLADMAMDDTAAFGIPARAANTLVGMGDKERGSVLSTARRHTAFLDDPRIATALSRSDFDLSNIKSTQMSVYLALPANKIGANARFVRLLIGSIIAAITSSTEQPKHRVGFFLDEFAQLGYLKQIEDSVSLLRGYGLSFWVFIQDLSQLKAVYPRWQTFLANSAKTFYGTDDYDTAKYISDSLGNQTIEFKTSSASKNKGSSGFGKISSGTGNSENLNRMGRSLLTPDEVMRLGPETPIVLLKGEYPYITTRLNYLQDQEYQGLADSNPYHN